MIEFIGIPIAATIGAFSYDVAKNSFWLRLLVRTVLALACAQAWVKLYTDLFGAT